MPQKIDELLKHNLKLTAEGSDEAFSKILKMYSPLINSLVAKYSSMGDLDSNDEEDMYQEAVLSLYKAAITYKPEIENVTFGLYARICISRRLISLLRHINIHKNRRICSVDEIDNALYSQYSDPALPLLNKESLSRLDEIIENHLSAYEKKSLLRISMV